MLPAAKSHAELHLGEACAHAFPNKGLQSRCGGEANPRAIAAFIASPGLTRSWSHLEHELYEPTEFAYADADAAEELSELIARLESQC